MNTELTEQIRALTERLIEDPSLFVVEVEVVGKKIKTVSITLDGDKGVTIEQCAELSRRLSEAMDEQNLLEDQHQLEVSSPGVEKPLRYLRQYAQHIGRRLEIITTDGQPLTGRLEALNGEILSIAKETKVRNKITTEPFELPFAQVRQALVVVSFK